MLSSLLPYSCGDSSKYNPPAPSVQQHFEILDKPETQNISFMPTLNLDRNRTFNIAN